MDYYGRVIKCTKHTFQFEIIGAPHVKYIGNVLVGKNKFLSGPKRYKKDEIFRFHVGEKYV